MSTHTEPAAVTPDEEALSQRRAAVPADALWSLQVRSGLHSGATASLKPDDWLLVGSAADCDVVLRDSGVLPHHMAVHRSGGGLVLRAVDGKVQVGERALAAGETATVSSVTLCALSNTALAVGPADAPDWQLLSEVDPDAGALAPLAVDAADAIDVALPGMPPSLDETDATHHLHLEPELDAQPGPPRLRSAPGSARRRWLAGTVAAGALLAGCVALGLSSFGQGESARQNKSAVMATLESLGLHEVRLVESTHGMLRLEGVVANEAQRSQLLQAIRDRGEHVVTDVVSGEHLAQGVQNSFRQRGFSVRAAYAGGGRIDVSGAPMSAPFERAIRDVLQANVGVAHIALAEGTAASTASSESKPSAEAALTSAALTTPAALVVPAPAAPDVGAKRVVGVVAGEQPYLLTQDGMRYLVGALLPDGTQVEHIADHTVVFSRNGKTMPVQF